MANTYTQSYFHLVFAVKHPEAQIKKSWKNEFEMYITGVIQNHKHKLLAIGSMPGHIHIFNGYYFNELIPDLVTGKKVRGVYSFPFSIRYRSKVCFKSGSTSSKEIISGRIYRNAY